ncbi:MAG: XRE family transcriptional regulator [Bacteroidetes bacterium]|nr:MAG: XRE family transcriptional regulator [Bacteroidota bacterium]TAG89884.1 MAG: XRE family transcriptional regulator [Bacteroidota bacterium]
MAKTIYSKRRNFLSARLIEARETTGLTQAQVAESGIISQTELSKIENGQRRVEFLLLLDLAELYSQKIEFFVPPKE